MKNKDISRRKFLNLSGNLLVAGVGAGLILPQFGFSKNSLVSSKSASNKITAGEVIERIKQNVGITWREQSVDVIKAGNPDIIVTGITSTFMSTLDVLQKSVKAGRNFVITHEPTFWNGFDESKGLTDDPLYQHKLDFINKNNLVVWRFHDHWHGRKPDGINEGINKELGWDHYKQDETHGVFELPNAITLEVFAREVKSRLKSDNIRVIGNPRLIVKKVSKNFNKLAGGVSQVQFADAFIVKEADRENDLGEWCRDNVLSGQKKGFIFISHNIGEEAGMENCANWVRKFIPEVPVDFIPSGDPFWRTI